MSGPAFPQATLDFLSGITAHNDKAWFESNGALYEAGYVAAGKAFVEAFAEQHERYPSSSGASAYTIVHQWKEAVERAQTFAGADVVRALEGSTYTVLKDEQEWRAFDHQSIQTVYAVKCRTEAEVEADKFGLDYFEIISGLDGDEAFRTREEWDAVRIEHGKPTYLEELPGDAASL